jgi:hypothetical protein
LTLWFVSVKFNIDIWLTYHSFRSHISHRRLVTRLVDPLTFSSQCCLPHNNPIKLFLPKQFCPRPSTSPKHLLNSPSIITLHSATTISTASFSTFALYASNTSSKLLVHGKSPRLLIVSAALSLFSRYFVLVLLCGLAKQVWRIRVAREFLVVEAWERRVRVSEIVWLVMWSVVLRALSCQLGVINGKG